MSDFQWYIAKQPVYGFNVGDKITAPIVSQNGTEEIKGKSVNIIGKMLKALERKGKLEKCLSPAEEMAKEKPESLFSQDIKVLTIPTEESQKAEKYFKNPELLLLIHEEISKSHLMDDDVKLATFLVCGTSYLSPDRLHMSMALKGSSSVGKDNLLKTVLAQFPLMDWIFLTNATQATMEDDIGDYKIVAYSEMNLQRDDKGANAHIVEVIKQMADGGTSALKKDLKTGYKTTSHIKQAQKTVLYGTTETQDDEELATRFIVGSVEASTEKIKAVNDHTFDWFSGKRDSSELSWIAIGIIGLGSNEVILPYIPLFRGSGYFDNSDPRSMRDVKRMLACACVPAWLHQKTRAKDEWGRIISEPFDFLAALIVTGKLFNHTYQGLGDQRIQNFIDAMNTYCDEKGTDIFPRHEIQAVMGCSIPTVRALSKGCQDLSIIRRDHTENSVIYYKRCKKGVNRMLMGANWREVMENLFIKGGVKISQRDVEILEKLDKICNPIYGQEKTGSISGKIYTPKFTPLLKFDDWALIHPNGGCEYPIGDSACGDIDCNELVDSEGYQHYYCKTHFGSAQEGGKDVVVEDVK